MDPAGTTTPPRIPFDAPRARTGRDLWDDVKTGLDFVAHNLPRVHGLFVRLNPYPHPWRAVSVLARDGARLAAWHGPGRPGAPAVLMVPGTFQTKDDTPRKRRALRLWRDLGAHVLILDLRGFGGSHAHLGSAGYLEARDLHDAADLLRELSGQPRVHLWGESLGGAVSLLSAALPGAEERFEQVVAWSPFCDLTTASRVASPDDPVGRTMLGRTYRWLLRRRTGNEARTFEEYLAVAAQRVGVPVEELVRHGSPIHHVHALRVRAHVFHAEDDPVVAVEHARRLEGAAAQRLSVAVLPRGGHLDFDREAPVWFEGVTRSILLGSAQAP